MLLLLMACTGGTGRDRDDDGEPPCPGAPESSEFDVFVRWIQASPLDPDVNTWTGQRYETWDWDGDVPDDWVQASSDLAEALGLLAEAYPTQETVAVAELADITEQILIATDEYAPYLMASYVEPELDLYAFHVWSDDEYIEHGNTGVMKDDSLVARPWIWLPADFSGDDDALVLAVIDVDLISDDWVGGVALDRAFARRYAGCGVVLEHGVDGLFGAGVEVVALD